MKYTVKTLKTGCVEKLELSNGMIFTKTTKKTDNGYESIDLDIIDQMKQSNVNEEIIKVAENIFDGVTSLNFFKLAELDK